MVTYGGDEVQGVTLDVGTSSTRLGYSGTDTPCCIIPSSYGAAKDKLYFGHAGAAIFRPELEVKSPLHDSIIDDWDAAERLITYAVNDGLRLRDLSENPLLVTEAAWTPKENREKMAQLAFEKLQVPAYYSVDRAVASAFAAGKGSALVVDIGEDSASIVPIYDGFVIAKSIRRSPLCGSLLSQLVSRQFRTMPDPCQPSQPYRPAPQYLIGARNPVELQQRPVVTYRTDRPATESFARHAEQAIVHEFKEAVCEVCPVRWNDQVVSTKGSKPFEFPDGYQPVFNAETRMKLPEVFFNPAACLPPDMLNATRPPSKATIPLPPLSAATSIAQLCLEATSACDADLQQALLGNLVVVGGSTLIPGFCERLSWEVAESSRGVKPKLTASGLTVERKYAAWLGGSILSSLGSFHQLWISKAEYEEVGAGVVHRRAR